MSEAQHLDFVHLHVHTEFSLLDGLCKIDKLVKYTKETLGMKSLAITDHGAMHGVVSFFRACKAAEIKPIIGMEAYLARRNMRIHDTSEKSPFHLLLLARNNTGYKNLLKIASTAQLEGFYNRPRVDKDFLAAHAEGLICTSGCLAAEIPRLITEGREEEARQTIGWYQDTFGKENFFLELQSHDIEELFQVNKWLVQNREFADVPLLATNDVHYIKESDADPHDTLLCIQTGAKKLEQKRMRMTDPSYFMRSAEQMWEIFHEVPDAIHNTLLVAEMCDVDLTTKGYHLPIFPVPGNFTPESYLRHLATRGLTWRYGEGAERDPRLVERLTYELSTIHKMGFDTYFLIVWDLCQFARHADIWWNVRGSGAGSLAAYTLGITNIDPMHNNLIFERFLNPGRVSMPDIDMDFPDDRRSEMIDYAMRKYGSDKVAAIITFGTMKARAAIKDVGRALDYPLPVVNELTQLVPQIPSRPVTLADCLSDDDDKSVPALKERYHGESDIKILLDNAMLVEGMSRNAGTHAAGVIIGDAPLVEYLPLHRPIGDTRLTQVTQFPMETCESIGLLKVDFLGLSTLTIMRKACELIEKYHGIQYSMDNIPYRPDPSDPRQAARVAKLFELIGNGETTGVFQLESAGMKKMLIGMKPKTFEHIIAAISLYRPGPMDLIPTFIQRMHGHEKVQYHHELLVPILSETYGICVYQEQIQQIAAQLFGYSLGEADMMRRAVSKKKAKDLLTHKEIFKERGPEHGVDAETAEKIFADIEFFAAYGFNKAHAADYAVLTCQTAYLKAHYPEEYYTALLSVQRDNIADVALFTADCRKFGIPILPPDVNASDVDFTIEVISGESNKRGIRYGLSAIKNVGEKAIEEVIRARKENGKFSSISDFARRADLRLLGKKALESLTKVGAFDSFSTAASFRDDMLASLDRIVSYSADQHRAIEVGQSSLFEDTLVNDDAGLALSTASTLSDSRERMRWEKDLIGLSVSQHPMDTLIPQLERLPNFTFVFQLRTSDDDESAVGALNGRQVALAGLVIGVRTITTRKNEEMAVVTVEDNTGQIDCVFFPRTWRSNNALVKPDALLLIYGKSDLSRGDPQVLVDRVTDQFDYVTAIDTIVEVPSTRSPVPEQLGSTWDAVPPEPELFSEPPSPEQYGYVIQGNGNNNGSNSGNENTNGRSYHDLPPDFADPFADDESRVQGPPVKLITITFVRTENAEKDRRRIDQIIRKLTEYPGRDRFQFRIIGHDKTFTWQPDYTTEHSTEVDKLLTNLVGEDHFYVDDFVGTSE